MDNVFWQNWAGINEAAGFAPPPENGGERFCGSIQVTAMTEETFVGQIEVGSESHRTS
jgi:hypothetical protein